MQRSVFILFFFISFSVVPQRKATFFLDGELEAVYEVKDSLGLLQIVREYNLEAIANGYWFAGVDSISSIDSETHIYLHKGEKFESEIIGLRKNFTKSFTNRIKYLANNGYPFATISIDSSQIGNQTLRGRLVEVKGPYIRNDSAFFYQPVKTNTAFIYHTLEHVPGTPFNESAYRNINDKLQRTSFLSFNRAADISFQREKAKLYLDIIETESNTFQGVLGLQQQGSDKSTLVGGFDLSIQNLFRSGKEFELSWTNFSMQSQELTLKYVHPFLFGSKLTPFFHFNLLRQDTTFIKRSTNLGISSYISPRAQINLAYNRRTGSLLTMNETALIGADIADFTADVYQIQLQRGQFRELNKPKENFVWQLGISVGSKQVEKNANLAASFYDTLILDTDIFQYDFRGGINLKISKRRFIHQMVEGGIIKNDALLNNERYRIGGLTSLRGFNEKFFFADQYILSRTEVRSFFEKGSFIYLFYDQLLMKNDRLSDVPFGVGLGFVLATLSGQFNFALATGKSKNQNIDLSNLKAHFGFITKF